MQKQPHYLITTADERTWKFDQPVVFLGKWCLNYGRKNIWKNMDAIIAPPYGLSTEKKNIDYAEVIFFIDKSFPVFCNILNSHHGVNYSVRFWKILLGHWFQRYVNTMFNRYRTIEQCMKHFKISATAVYVNSDYTLATSDSLSAIYAFEDDRWNNLLNLKIFEFFEDKIKFDFICDKNTKFSISNKEKLIKKSLSLLTNKMIKNSDALIIDTYLPKFTEVKLQLALNQFPQIFSFLNIQISEKVNSELRKDLTKKITGEIKRDLEYFLKSMLFELLPVCYLEGFESLNNLVKKQYLPKNPKFIFTSIHFDTNEIFKLWAATKVENGVKYFVGQHGNNYGTYKYDDPTVEELTSDKFITWGWKNELPQHTPAFILKIANKKLNYDNQGGLLLIERVVPHRTNTWDVWAEFDNYFKEQHDFVNALTNKLKQKMTIRLHSTFKLFKWDEETRWKDYDPSLKINNGSSDIADLIRKSKLVVHSYDSTGMLETLSSNIPTLAFWQNGFDHLKDSAKPYYQLLLDAGIVHLTPESAAQKANKIWDSVDNWWKQNEIQEARKVFCDQYAKLSNNPVDDLITILKN